MCKNYYYQLQANTQHAAATSSARTTLNENTQTREFTPAQLLHQTQIQPGVRNLSQDTLSGKSSLPVASEPKMKCKLKK